MPLKQCSPTQDHVSSVVPCVARYNPIPCNFSIDNGPRAVRYSSIFGRRSHSMHTCPKCFRMRWNLLLPEICLFGHPHSESSEPNSTGKSCLEAGRNNICVRPQVNLERQQRCNPLVSKNNPENLWTSMLILWRRCPDPHVSTLLLWHSDTSRVV